MGVKPNRTVAVNAIRATSETCRFAIARRMARTQLGVVAAAIVDSRRHVSLPCGEGAGPTMCGAVLARMKRACRSPFSGRTFVGRMCRTRNMSAAFIWALASACASASDVVRERAPPIARGIVAFAFALALAGCRDTWGSHREAGLCRDAIAGRAPWPHDVCRAMQMCANEASLSGAERQQLISDIISNSKFSSEQRRRPIPVARPSSYALSCS
jgi:hypothetical protein